MRDEATTFGSRALAVALERFDGTRGEEQVAAFMEVVWWVDACSELKWAAPDDRPEILLAVRGARNAGAHRLVEPIEVGYRGGLTVPFTVPFGIHATRVLTWRQDVASAIRPERQRVLYLDRLADREVERTLNEILAELAFRDPRG